MDIVLLQKIHHIKSDNNRDTDFKKLGCKIQVSADFMGEGSFSPIKKTAKKLFEEDLVNFIASDAHGPLAYELLWRARKEFFAKGAHART